jgi:D-tyrosyl-tRNA(Tyr) deacylase
MRAVIQRVSCASVTVEDQRVAEIGLGLLVLLGIGAGDDEEKARYMARKISLMRIFEDDAGKMNLGVMDVGGSVIVVSQFTLYADTRKGNRPAFIDAAPPEIASPLVDRFTDLLREQGVPVQTGVFGAHMVVDLVNDGPVTIVMEA